MHTFSTHSEAVIRLSLFLLVVLTVTGLAQNPAPETFAGPPPPLLLPDANHEEIPLWPNGAPGSEGKKGAERYRLLGDRLILSNIHRPSITLYLPPAKVSTGAAVVVIPGGGFRSNWITHEGYRVAEWFARHGIAAFVLKYRLEKDAGSGYTTMDHSLADIQRAIRTVRSRALEWSVDPKRIGVIGFSAGGVLAGLAGTHYNDPVRSPVDPIDKLSARPAFQGLIYGSPFGSSRSWPIELPKDTPPVFLLSGGDDKIAADYPDIYKRLKAAGVPTELHIFAGVGHGFGIQPHNSPSVAGWIDRFYDWLFSLGIL
jgi:endo-1,4-beta-xylanase